MFCTNSKLFTGKQNKVLINAAILQLSGKLHIHIKHLLSSISAFKLVEFFLRSDIFYSWVFQEHLSRLLCGNQLRFNRPAAATAKRSAFSISV